MESQDKVNILLVDDRLENLTALEAALHGLNARVVTARSGNEALKHVLLHDFAVILLDVKMPGMDGFETAEIIRSREKSASTPIIFVTANYTEDEHFSKGYSVGAVDYILKPFSLEVLRSKVSVFIELYKKTAEAKRQAELILEIEQREYEARLAEVKRRVEAENYRVRQEQRVAQAVVEHAPLGIVRLDNNQVISEVNRTFAAQFRVNPELLMKKSLINALPWLPRELVESSQEGRQYLIEQFRVEDDDDPEWGVKYLDLAVWPVKGQDGALVGTVLMAEDVTERVWLNQQREDFAATLAHDLQTPVIASNRALELLLDMTLDKLEPDAQKLVSMLKKNNENLLSMIQSLLDVYRYESGAQAMYFDHVDIRPLVIACVDELLPLAAKQGITLTASLPEDLAQSWADRTALRRVIMNLLDNALKFTPSGGQVEVTARNADGSVMFLVSDTGRGISVEDQQKLFKRFWHRGDYTSYKASSGLGLYLCKQIVEAHGGKIECASQPGQSSVFSVTLPVNGDGNLSMTNGVALLDSTPVQPAGN